VVCMGRGTGGGVLVRALHVTDGVGTVRARRAGQPRRAWTDGPGKLCRALGLDLRHDGLDLTRTDHGLRLVDRGLRVPDDQVRAGPRVGISKARDLPWRLRVDPSLVSPSVG
jgi:DNA-3-methyladenine glycosylase